jgi:hypothetical protein
VGWENILGRSPQMVRASTDAVGCNYSLTLFTDLQKSGGGNFKNSITVW